jgi:hypothetical protein
LEAPLGGETDERGEALVDQRGRTRLDTIGRFTIGALMSPDVSQKADIYPRGFRGGTASTCNRDSLDHRAHIRFWIRAWCRHHYFLVNNFTEVPLDSARGSHDQYLHRKRSSACAAIPG